MGVDSRADEDTKTSLESHQDTLNTKNITFVDALNSEISDALEQTSSLQYDYVLGDVSDYGVSGNGHAHFDLVHGGSTIHCVIFSYRLRSLTTDIDDGTQIAVKGELSFYEANGSVSLIVEDFVEIGAGTYQQTYQENKRILEEDGLLADETKQSLPEFPRRIGIVTSADSDARKDAVTSIHGRHPDVDIVIQHSSVQGDDAMLSMMQAISILDDNARIDVIVLTRGGGSDKDLRVFNETPLCRVIHNTTTPIVIGVGHENDRTLADEVADKRVMTPTHAGEIVPKKERLETSVQSLAERLDETYERTVRTRLEATENELDSTYDHHVTTELANFATDLDHTFEAVASERLTILENQLDHALESLEQRKAHEQEKAAAAEAYTQSQRRQGVTIAMLVILVLALLGYILL